MKILLCLLLVLSLLMSYACAESIDLTVSQPFLSVHDYPVHWEDGYFDGDACEYDHGLCLLSLGMALAGMDIGNTNEPEVITDFFARLGFTALDVQQYDVRNEDSIGSVLARKTVNGREVIAVVPRSGDYGDEWLSNFDCGDEGVYHAGFESAARKLMERVTAYVQGVESPIFWMAGYSRGAAVMNLTAAFISEAGLAQDSDIFCYTFATPRTVMESRSNAHPNVFNMIHRGDIVPRLPPSEWGYARYGRTLALPSPLEGDAYERLLPRYQDAFRSLTGQEDALAYDTALFRIAENTEKGLADASPSRIRYADVYQPLLESCYRSKGFDGLTGMDRLTFLGLAATVCVRAFQDEDVPATINDDLETLTRHVTRLSSLWQNHMPGHYAAWLMVMDGTEFTDEYAP